MASKQTKTKNAGKKQGNEEYEVGKNKPPKDTQFKPGKSGNPKGKAKGVLNFATRLDMALDRLTDVHVEQYNKKHKKKITAEDVDIMGDVIAQLVNKARNGDQKAIDSLLDRAYGKATQPLEVGGMQDNPLVEAQRKAALAEADAWQAQWLKLGNKKHADTTTTTTSKGKGK